MHSAKYDVVIIGGGQAGLCLALQLKQALAELSILAVERNSHPLPVAAHKVGESVVEISSIYMSRILDLGDELAKEIPKFGLRFFFTGADNTGIKQRFELGASHYLSVPAFHIDRGSFETAVALKCKKKGIEFVDNCRIAQIQLGIDDHPHRLTLKHRASKEEQDVQCGWLVDASGRAGLLKRKFQLSQANRHNVNAAWFRIDYAFQLDDWCADPAWKERVLETRRLSTNHFMGEGYWLWFIPLANDRTSIGIVAENRRHPINDINTFEKALDWIERFEPMCASMIKPHLDKVMDFKCLRNFSYNVKQVFSSNRWCLTGEAGVFLDPFYSPGGDFIAISNGFITELILRHHRGEDISLLAQEFDRSYQRLYLTFLSVYNRQYQIMGNTRVMSLKIIWDFMTYWSCVALLYCSQKIFDLEFMRRIDAILSDYGFVTILMQKFFREWAKQDTNPTLTGFLDYSEIGFLSRLNANLLKGISDDDELQALLAQNLIFLKEVQQEIITRVGQIIPELAEPTNVKSNHLEEIFKTLDM